MLPRKKKKKREKKCRVNRKKFVLLPTHKKSFIYYVDGVTTIFNQLKDSNSIVFQVAFVMAHEMAHHYLDHHAEGISLMMVGPLQKCCTVQYSLVCYLALHS